MILPGISGSFILLMLGMYDLVLEALNDRELLILGVFAFGCAVGLMSFSQLLHWALDNFHDLVVASLIGLMIGSLRVLWPWPDGTEGTAMSWPSGDVIAPVVLAILGFAVVVTFTVVADRLERRAGAADSAEPAGS